MQYPHLGEASFDVSAAWLIEEMDKFKNNVPPRVKIKEHLNVLIQQITEKDIPIEMGSGVSRWASYVTSYTFNDPTGSPQSPFSSALPLYQDLNEIAEKIIANTVTIIEAPTGTGKSIQMPAVIHHIAKCMAKDGTIANDVAWKAIHLVPSGEQAIQLYNKVSSTYKKTTIPKFDRNITFGVYSGAASGKGVIKKEVVHRPNYVFATTFFGTHVLDGSVFAIIIDEVHEMTPELSFLLFSLRQSLIDDTNKFVKVVLVSATLPEKTRTDLKHYFKDVSVGNFIKKEEVESYPVTTISISDPGSLVNRCNGSLNDRDLMGREEDRDGRPITKVLRDRAVNVIRAEIQQWIQSGRGNRGKTPGIISFHCGQSELNQARSAVVNSVEVDDFKTFEGVFVTKICGKDRADIDNIDKEYVEGANISLIFSTPLLATGVTLNGIGIVIDDGVVKIPGPYSQRGLFHLDVCWQDFSMMMQKKGRVGRINSGTYYQVFSQHQRDRITANTTLVEVRLERAYKTYHVPFFYGICNKLFFPIQQSIWKELIEECITLGMVEKSFRDNDRNEATRCTQLATYLGSAFMLPLHISDFIVRCHAFGVGLHALVFAASQIAEHDGIRKAKKGNNNYGRDDTNLPMNRWPQYAGIRRDVPDVSNFEVLCEMVLNLLLQGPAQHHLKKLFGERKKVNIKIREELEDGDRMKEIYRMMTITSSGLVALKIITHKDEIYKELMESYDFEKIGDGSTMFRLKSSHRAYFRACILASFGFRVAIKARNPIQQSRTTYYIPPAHSNVAATEACCGEMAGMMTSEIAVYDLMVRRHENDVARTGLLHYVSPLEYALFGNAMGAERDEVCWKDIKLKIKTSSCAMTFAFRDIKELKAVLNIRLIMKYLSENQLFKIGDHLMYNKVVRKMIDQCTKHLRTSNSIQDRVYRQYPSEEYRMARCKSTATDEQKEGLLFGAEDYLVQFDVTNKRYHRSVLKYSMKEVNKPAIITNYTRYLADSNDSEEEEFQVRPRDFYVSGRGNHHSGPSRSTSNARYDANRTQSSLSSSSLSTNYSARSNSSHSFQQDPPSGISQPREFPQRVLSKEEQLRYFASPDEEKAQNMFPMDLFYEVTMMEEEFNESPYRKYGTWAQYISFLNIHEGRESKKREFDRKHGTNYAKPLPYKKPGSVRREFDRGPNITTIPPENSTRSNSTARSSSGTAVHSSNSSVSLPNSTARSISSAVTATHSNVIPQSNSEVLPADVTQSTGNVRNERVRSVSGTSLNTSVSSESFPVSTARSIPPSTTPNDSSISYCSCHGNPQVSCPECDPM